MAKNELLCIERLRKGWDQQQLADFAQVSLSTVQRAERGKAIRIDNIQRLCACLEKTPEQLNLLKIGNETNQTSTTEDGTDSDATASLDSFNTSVFMYGNIFQVHDFIASNMTACLWNLAFNDRCSLSEMTYAIKQAIKEFDIMNADNENYPITRREALCQLATLPLITLQLQLPGSTIHPRRYDDAITHCTASLEACWQLYRSSDASGTQLAFQRVSRYVHLLGAIAKDSSRHQKEALDLAAQYALLQTLLGWEYAERRATIAYAQNMLSLSRATGNILLQLSAYPKLNWTYVRSGNYTEAWKTMQEGEHILKEYQRKKNGPSLPSGIIGNFYSSYCDAQVKNGISPDYALSIVTNSEPLNEHIAYVQFAAPDQWWEAAWAYCAKGDSIQAMVWLEKLIDSKTLAVHQGLQQTEAERIGAVNIMTRTLLQSRERDMERTIRVWKEGIQGAKALKHEVMYGEAITNFQIMQALWTGERRIMALAPLTSHW